MIVRIMTIKAIMSITLTYIYIYVYTRTQGGQRRPKVNLSVMLKGILPEPRQHAQTGHWKLPRSAPNYTTSLGSGVAHGQHMRMACLLCLPSGSTVKKV